MRKKVAVLGASGSIGKSALDILRSERDFYEPVLFSCHRNTAELLALSREFPKALLVLTGPGDAPPEVLRGIEGLRRGIAQARPDIGVNGVAGAAGLEPSLALLEAGADLALANKETIVMAAPLVKAFAAKMGCKILPVDSEHSAIFTLLEAHGRDKTQEILLTASGGPFRNSREEELAGITPEEALMHPTWKMGPKITIDSATLANKGLEVIEATGLFDFPADRITVVIHPQSVVHSMIRLKNGGIYGELSKPDMRLPIHNALSYPDCRPCEVGALNFDALTLEFFKPDGKRFPMLPLAYEAARLGGEYPTAYNGANEVAVAAFLGKKIGFLAIPAVVDYVLQREWRSGNLSPGAAAMEEDPRDGLAGIWEADRRARRLAEDFIREMQ